MIKQLINPCGLQIKTVNGNESMPNHDGMEYRFDKDGSLLVKFTGLSLANYGKISRALLALPVLVYNDEYIVTVYRTIGSYESTEQLFIDPAYDESCCETSIRFEGKPGKVIGSLLQLDLTKLFNKWQTENETNMSITIKHNSQQLLKFYGMAQQNDSFKPKFYLDVFQTNGLSPFFNYETRSLGDGGTAYVNTLTGKLCYQVDLMRSLGKFPIDLKVYYSDKIFAGASVASLPGKWRMSYDLEVSITPDLITLGSPNGVVSYYHKTSKNDAIKYDIFVDGNCFINFVDYSYITTQDNQSFKLIDRAKTNMEFNYYGQIGRITANDGSYIIYSYNGPMGEYIGSITSSDGSSVTISYDNEYRPSFINFINEGVRVALSYNNQGIGSVCLQKFGVGTNSSKKTTPTYQNLCLTYFYYTSDRLDRVEHDTTKERLKFEYLNEKATKVTSEFYDLLGSYVTEKLDFIYQNEYTKVLSSNGAITNYMFDNYGMPMVATDDYGNSQNFKHEFVGIDGQARRVVDASSVIQNVQNIILDSNLESSIGNITSNAIWKTDNGVTSSIVQSESHGPNVFKIQGSNNTTTIVQEITTKNGTYEFTCFVKTKNTSGNSKLKIELFGNNVEPLADWEVGLGASYDVYIDNYYYRNVPTFAYYESETINNTNSSEWRKVVIPNIVAYDYYNNPQIKVMIETTHSSGDLYVGEIALTPNGKKSEFNLVSNGFFENENGSNIIPDGFALSDSYDWLEPDKLVIEQTCPASLKLGAKSFMFNSNGEIVFSRALSKTINVGGNAGDEFTFCVWAKAYLLRHYDYRRIEDGDDKYETVEKGYDSLVAKIRFNNANGVSTYKEIGANPYLSGWQMLSKSIVAATPFESITIEISYEGFNKAYINGIQLYRNSTSKQYDYNLKGDLISIAQNAATTSVSTNEEKLKQVSNSDGDTYRFEYDESGNLIKLIDSKNNTVNFGYDVNNNQDRVVIKAVIGGMQKIIEYNKEFNADNQLIESSDEFGNTVSYTYDQDQRLKTITNPIGVTTTYSYDILNNLTSIIKSQENEITGCTYQYNFDRTLKKIICPGNMEYAFQYDSYRRVSDIKLNGNSIVFFLYGLSKNGVNTGLVTKAKLGLDYYDYTYDNELRLKTVSLNGNLLVTNEYDNLGTLISKTTSIGTTYFTYDSKGNLLNEIVDNGDNFGFVYDNLNQLQSLSMNINGFTRYYNYDYDYETKEFSIGALKNKLDKDFGDDIIDFHWFNKWGIHGASPTTISGVYEHDVVLNKGVFRLNDIASRIVYPLDTVNSKRTGFSKVKWDEQFLNSKGMYGWFKFSKAIGLGHKIFAFGDDNQDMYFVTITHVNSNYEFRMMKNTTGINEEKIMIVIPATNDWIFIGMRVNTDGEIDSETKMTLCVNGETNIYNYDGVNVPDLTKFIIGDRNINVGSGINNSHIEEVSMIGIGAFEHSAETYKNIHNQGRKYVELANIIPKTGVTFANQKTHENNDLITLNGTLKSIRGIEPITYGYLDNTFMSSKAKIFEYDRELRKHVYGAYSTMQGLSANTGKLTYKLGLKSSGTMSIKFLVDTYDFNNNYIFSNTENGVVKLGAYINQDGEIQIVKNGYIRNTQLCVTQNFWHKLVISWYNSDVVVFLDEVINPDSFSAYGGINQTGATFVVGAKLDGNGNISNHLEGRLEMLTFGDGVDQGAVESRFYEEQLISIYTERDVLGRMSKSVIETGVATLENQYLYKTPNLGKTSMQIESIIKYDNTSVVYEYDAIGNITSMTTSDGEYKYTYDYLSRLIEEYNPILDETTEYEYETNNNISVVRHYQGNATTTLIKTETYNYNDNNLKDKLTSVTTVESGNPTTRLYEYNSGYFGNPSVFDDATLTWQGRRLTSFTKGNTSVNYTYNEANIRTSKTIGNVTTNYHLLGDTIVGLDKGNDTLLFHYDEKNLLVGFEYEKENYFYIRDLTGIITEVIDKNGTKMVQYKYDAWGKWINQSNGQNDSALIIKLRELNPFIYKGYCYDKETGLYYLKSRYDSPSVRRFINIDSVLPDIGDISQTNLFAYCFSDPVGLVESEYGIICSIGGGDVGVGGGESLGVASSNNPSANMWLKLGVGAIPDIITGIRYLAAKGVHTRFAYSTNNQYRFPKLGSTWRQFYKGKSSYGDLVGASFKQIIAGDAKAGFGAIAKSVGKTALLTGLVNFGFNLYENNWQVDGAMLLDTAIDTAIGLGAYGLAAGTASLAIAGLAMAGFSIPGFVVVVAVIGLSIFFDWVIREITGYKK